MEKSSGRRNYFTRRNMMEWYQITRGTKKLEKEDGQSWEENGIVYMDGRIYVLNNRKIVNQWI